MRYLLLIFDARATLDGQAACDGGALLDACGRLDASGHLVHLLTLKPAATATTIRQCGDSESTHDGPATPAAGELDGCLVIEAPDLDRAIAIARELADTARGAVEIRPVAAELRSEP